MDQVENDINEDKPLQGSSHYGDLLGQLIPNIAYAVGHWAFGSNEFANHMFDATLHAGLMTLILKYSVRERRPNNADRLSFPSGHTATAFAFASVVGIHHDFRWGALAYAIASFIGLSRVNDKDHHVHDVLAGATIGMSYGYGTYFLKSSGSSIASNLNIFPIIGKHNETGIALSYVF